MKRDNLKKLNDGEGKQQYQVKVSNKFATFENIDGNWDINRTLENTMAEY